MTRNSRLFGPARARHRAVAFGVMAISAILAAPAVQAQSVTNGTFLNPSPAGAGGSAIPGWTQSAPSGDDCVVVGTTWCSTTTWGTKYAPGTPLVQSPLGGNFYADALRAASAVTLSQQISGLTAGDQYTLTFEQAGFALSNAVGAPTTAEQWAVTFGTSTQDSAIMNVSSSTNMSWTAQSLTFTATAATETLSFLTHLGAPSTTVSQFAALADVSLTQTTTGHTNVPEPASIALLGFGIAGIAGLRRRRARAAV